MRLGKGYYAAALAAAMLLVILVIAFALEIQDPEQVFEGISFCEEEHGLTLQPYYDRETQKYYLFLPAFAQPEQILVAYSGRTAWISEKESPKTLADFPLWEDIPVTLPSLLGDRNVILQLWQYESLPVISLDGPSSLLTYLHKDKENDETVDTLILDGDGKLLYQDTAKISGRGNSTWLREKKPYNLTLNQSIPLGPFASLQKLALLAEFTDESRMRNASAFLAAGRLGLDYASEYAYCALYINGQFQGLYGIATKEGYLPRAGQDGIQAVFEISSSESGEAFRSSLGYRIRVIYGDMALVRSRVTLFENALVQEDWAQCSQLMDMESFARKHAFEEFIGNTDMSYASQYFYIGRDGRLRCMLPWDYDLSLGSQLGYFNDSEARSLHSYHASNSWYTRLLNWEAYSRQILRIFEQEYTDDILTGISAGFSGLARQITAARRCDLLRWGLYKPNVYLLSGMTGPEEFADYFSALLWQRRDFLIRYFANPSDWCRLEFRLKDYPYLCLCIPRGNAPGRELENTNYFLLSSQDSVRWYTQEGIPLDLTSPVTENQILNAGSPASEQGIRSWLSPLVETYGTKGMAVMGVYTLAMAAALGLTWLRCRRKEDGS